MTAAAPLLRELPPGKPIALQLLEHVDHVGLQDFRHLGDRPLVRWPLFQFVPKRLRLFDPTREVRRGLDLSINGKHASPSNFRWET